jgi:uncharacterized lipoprotein YddW (UPF0748 family)
MNITRRSFIAGGSAMPALGRAAGRPPAATVKALWITRFDYRTAQDVDRIAGQAAAFGFTDLFFQIRGNGTVFYPSRYEPWAGELTGGGAAATGRHPGWDPLSRMIGAAHRNGMRIHAYANVLPGWRGRQDPPVASAQLWMRHRDWFMVDRLNYRMQPTSKWYSFLIPSHPEVRRHLFRLFTELSRYPVDGIHLDYIRFPEDYHSVNHEIFRQADKKERLLHSDFSYDPVSLHQFGRSPQQHPQAWDRFRLDAVTGTVETIRKALPETPQKVLSASLVPEARKALTRAFQDGAGWTRSGLLDWGVPMLYSQGSAFHEQLLQFKEHLGARSAANRMIAGLNGAHDPAVTERQLADVQAAGCRGFAFFAWSYLCKGGHLTEKGRALRRLLS